MSPDPLALARWWRAVANSHPRTPDSPVLRWHFNGVEYLVRAADLEAAVGVLESRGAQSAATRTLESPTPPGRGDTPPLSPGTQP